jgi:hypothetical protein
VLGQAALQLAIEVADPGITTDQTNLMLETIVCGRLNLYVKVHPNYEETLRYYWSGWRQQPRIAEELIWVVKEELKRYPISDVPLLPENLLKPLRTLNVEAELKNLDPVHRAELAARFLDGMD